MTRVAVVGCAGRMGRTLIEAIGSSDGLVLGAATERPGSSLVGTDAGELAGMGKLGIEVADSLRSVVDDFDVVITRDDPVRPKPHPDGVLLAAERFQVDPQTVLVVGDFHFDIDAGRQAGALTALLDEGHTDPEGEIACDFRVTSLSEIERIVRCGRPLPNGKFPNDLLEEFFGHLQHDKRRFLIKPGIGEDTAAIDIAIELCLLLKMDIIDEVHMLITDRDATDADVAPFAEAGVEVRRV